MKLCGEEIGPDRPMFLIAGPCVIESRQSAIDTAGAIDEVATRLGIFYVYKSSYDKANRTSGKSFRGPGIDEGLSILSEVKKQIGCPVLTDVHLPAEVETAAPVVDILQTPAYLCRQTDLIDAVAASGKPFNIKKGQFLSPREMISVLTKAIDAGAEGRILVCERGSTFGYNNLVVDMRSLAVLGRTNCPVVFDATHSVQLPGSEGTRSGGQREFIAVLARAAVAVGVSGLFMETHPNPDNALSDGPNAWPLGKLEALIEPLMALDAAAKQLRWPEV